MPRKSRVLVVDDKMEMGEMLADGLADRGYQAVAVSSGGEALRRLEKEPFDALVTDLRMPDVDGLSLLKASKKSDPSRPVIVMTAFGAIDSAIDSIQQGAYHYLTKPFKVEELAVYLGRALEEGEIRREAATLKNALKERFATRHVIGRSGAMQRVFDLIERVAPSDVPVLLLGDTGTGKGLLARTLHAEGPRAGKPFVQVNCAALPENLLESELFGYAKGAFTGAVSDRRGLFAEADGGTLFLDEVGEMPLALQAKLLLVLENGTIRPVGATREQAVDVRILAATHQNLRDRVAARTFREDLLYRLEVITLEVPALRERREDLPLLIDHFFRASRERHPSSVAGSISAPAMKRLLEHSWPGNVRELANVVERLVLLARSGEIGAEELPETIGAASPSTMSFGGEVVPIREMQRRYAAWALEQCGGHRGRAAERLEVDGKTLARWLSGAG